MMRILAVAIFGLSMMSLTQPVSAQETSPGMPAGLLPGSYSQQVPVQEPARGSDEPTVPGGDHTASAPPAGAETPAPSMPGNSPGNGMVLGGSDASAALPEMQVPQRPGEGKGTLQ